MDIITDFFGIGFPAFLTTFFLFLCGILSILSLLEKTAERFGIELKWLRKKREDHELLAATASRLDHLQEKHTQAVAASVRRDTRMEEDLAAVSEKMDSLSRQITEMQQKMDETEMAKLKDALVTCYRKHKDSDTWSRLEHDAFWDLFHSYEAHGGNGYIHRIIEPAMRELQIEE